MKDSGKNKAMGVIITFKKYIIRNPFIRPKITPPILSSPLKTGTLKILCNKLNNIFTTAFTSRKTNIADRSMTIMSTIPSLIILGIKLGVISDLEGNIADSIISVMLTNNPFKTGLSVIK